MENLNEQEVTNEVTELTVVKKEGLLAKAKNGVKKHGKKIVGAVLLAGVGIVAYATGKKAGSRQDDSEDDLAIYDLDVEDIPDDEE